MILAELDWFLGYWIKILDFVTWFGQFIFWLFRILAKRDLDLVTGLVFFGDWFFYWFFIEFGQWLVLILDLVFPGIRCFTQGLFYNYLVFPNIVVFQKTDLVSLVVHSYLKTFVIQWIIFWSNELLPHKITQEVVLTKINRWGIPLTGRWSVTAR